MTEPRRATGISLVVQGYFRVRGEPKHHVDYTTGSMQERLLMQEDKDLLATLAGDGLARVTASIAVKDSDYGNGFEAFATISLSCNQDTKTVAEAFDVAGEIARQAVDDLFSLAHMAYTDLGPHPKAVRRDRR